MMTRILERKESRILVVDDEPSIRKIVQLLLKNEDCTVEGASNTVEAEALMEEHSYDVVLLDIGLPGESGMDYLVRSAPRYPETLFIMSTGVDDAAVAAQAMRNGAVDYIVKPYSHGTFLSSLRNAFEKRDLEQENRRYREGLERTVEMRTRQVREAQDATVFAMAKIAQSRDDETGLHLERMRDYCVTLSRALDASLYPGLDEHFILDLYRSAPLHDIGKVGIPDAILLKRDRLTFEEFELMKTHSVIGAQCLEGAADLTSAEVGSFLRMGRDVARHHHESWDGTGYPDKLVGEEIPLAARILTVADFYDALAFPRVYRPTAFPHEEIVKMISELSGTKFDPDIVAVFLQVESLFEEIREHRGDTETYDDPTTP
jgi:putative two-component system response regulator